MIVKRVESSWVPLHENIVLEAKEQESAVFGTFLGDKEFWIEAGERVRIRVRKSRCIEVGDELSLEQVITPQNQLKFHWQWV